MKRVESGMSSPSDIDFVMKQCKKWNLVWVGKYKVTALEPPDMEMLFGFLQDHIRGVANLNPVTWRCCWYLNPVICIIRTDAAEVANLKSDLHALRLKLRKGRGAIEFEKKTRSANLQQYQEMDTKMTEMSNEIQRLRAHLPPSHPALGYAGPSDTVFRAPYSSHYPMHQAVVATTTCLALERCS